MRSKKVKHVRLQTTFNYISYECTILVVGECQSLIIKIAAQPQDRKKRNYYTALLIAF